MVRKFIFLHVYVNSVILADVPILLEAGPAISMGVKPKNQPGPAWAYKLCHRWLKKTLN